MPKGSFVYDRWVMLGLTVFSYQGLSFCDNFGIYSAQVKQQYGFSQDQLDSIATAGFWPNLVGAAIIPGLVNDRYGAPVTLVGAGVFTFLGLFVFWLTISEGIPIVAGSPHAQLMLCAGLTSWGLQWPSAAVMPANMKNFPAWREPVNSVCVIALLKCVGSVGGVLSVQLYLAFLAPNQTAYVLFLAVSALAIFLPGAPLQRFFPGPERADHPDEPGRFVVAFVTVAVVIVASIANAYVSDGLSHGVRALFAAAILVLFSVIGLSLVFDASWSKRSAHSAVSAPVLGSPLLGNDGSTGFTVQEDAEIVARSKQSRAGVSPAVYGELNIWQTMATLDCWLMVFCTFATMASNGVVSVNIAQICQAAGRPHATPFLLTLYGTGSAIGRLGSTAIAEALRRAGLPNAYSFALMCLDMLLAQLLMATSAYPGLVFGVPLTGLCNGGIWTLLPLVMAELFGLEHVGANYKIACFGEAIGFILIGRLLAAHIYEQAIVEGAGADSGDGSTAGMGADSSAGGAELSKTCFGPSCFRYTHLVCAGLCVVATLAGVVLGRRTGKRIAARDRAAPP